MAERSRYDIVIAGGGHNALVAATLLARAGRSVLVLERRGELGGAAVSARRSRSSGRGSRATPTWSACSRPRSRAAWGWRVELRRRRVGAYPPLEQDAAWRSFHAMLTRVAERVFPTLTEPLRSRAELRRLVGDDVAWNALFEAPAVRADRADVRLRPDARHGPDRRADRHVRARRRSAAAPEPLLPLPRDRQRDRPLGRAGRRDGRAIRAPSRAPPAPPAPSSSPAPRWSRSPPTSARPRSPARTGAATPRATCSPASRRTCWPGCSASRRPPSGPRARS